MYSLFFPAQDCSCPSIKLVENYLVDAAMRLQYVLEKEPEGITDSQILRLRVLRFHRCNITPPLYILSHLSCHSVLCAGLRQFAHDSSAACAKSLINWRILARSGVQCVNLSISRELEQLFRSVLCIVCAREPWL